MYNFEIIHDKTNNHSWDTDDLVECRFMQTPGCFPIFSICIQTFADIFAGGSGGSDDSGDSGGSGGVGGVGGGGGGVGGGGGGSGGGGSDGGGSDSK